MIRTTLALLALLTSCSTVPPTWFDNLTESAAGDLPTALLASAGAASPVLMDEYGAGLAGQVQGQAVVRHAPKLANVAGGLPLVAGFDGIPRADRPWRAQWSTRPTPAYAEGAATFPNVRTALLVTFKPPPTPSALPGGAGGMLMVPPDLVLIANDPRSPWLTDDGAGLVSLHYTFTEQVVGLRLWMQLVVADSRVPGGATTSPLLVLVIGSE